jgi:Calcineurin-like phosphoesterase
LLACTLLVLLPAVILGLVPLALTASIEKVKSRLVDATNVGLLLVILLALWIAWLGWRPIFGIVERNFWSLNALAVQPGYALWRETMRHLIERSIKGRTGADLARLRSASCIVAGILLFTVATLVALALWPQSRWIGSPANLAQPYVLVVHTLANAAIIMSIYLAIASLVWAVADATGGQPLDIDGFDGPRPGARTWRVVHLSDLHAVGERYGFRIESGRAGPRGNNRLVRTMQRLAALHAENPLDFLLVTGDMTDAGTSAEWAEFLDIIRDFPDLTSRMLILPGNHDVNIIDRSNPARLNLPFSPAKTLRKMRTISAMAVVQGSRVRTAVASQREPRPTLAEVLDSQRKTIEDFADNGGVRRSILLAKLWADAFPLILPPEEEDGLGIILLDSNADTSFSFTNALGLVSADQTRRLTTTLDSYPKAHWILALHHQRQRLHFPSGSQPRSLTAAGFCAS